MLSPPQGDLAAAELAIGEGGVLQYDPGDFHPVLADKMIAQAIPGTRIPWETRKGAGATLCCPR